MSFKVTSYLSKLVLFVAFNAEGKYSDIKFEPIAYKKMNEFPVLKTECSFIKFYKGNFASVLVFSLISYRLLMRTYKNDFENNCTVI